MQPTMADTLTYTVGDMTCNHCKQAVTAELSALGGVSEVEVDLASKRVVVRGERLEDSALRAAIREAGYTPA